MIYDFKKLKEKTKETEEWLRKEFMTIRTGVASTAILDGVQVESYGTRMPINQVANISTEDARSIRIAPWDKSQIKAVEKAIISAELGVSVNSDDKGIRVTFPELTSERRVMIIKTAKGKLEDAKQTLRGVRDEIWTDIQNKEKEGGMGEDDKFRFKDEMQKIIDECGRNLEALFDKKDKEINS